MSGVTIKIGSHFDNKGVKDAQKGISGLKGTISALKGLVAVTAIKTIYNGCKQLSDATVGTFRAQNEALVKMNAALRSNVKLTDQAKQNVIKYGQSLSKIHDGDSIAKATAIGANMGLDEKQLKETLSAAQDLAASGVMPLDQAVKTLATTYSGTAGQLGKLLPATKELTKEQLANGDAVKLVAAQYKGLADEMANTFSGRNTIFENSISDLKASIGSIFSGLQYEMQGAVGPIVDKVTGWITDHRKQILNIFLQMPALAERAFDAIKEILSKTFTVDGLKNLFTTIGNGIVISLKAAASVSFSLFTNVIKNIFSFLWDCLSNAGIWVSNLIASIGNKFIDTMNTAIQKVVNAPGVKDILEFFGTKVSEVKISYRFEDNKATKDLAASAEKIFDGCKNFASEFARIEKDAAKEQFDNLKKGASFYSDIAKDLTKDMGEIINRDLPESLQKAYNKAESGGANSSGADTSGLSGAGKSIESMLGPFASLIQCLGQLGTVIQAIMSSNWIGLLIQLIAALISDMSDKSEAFGKFLNCFSEFADAINNSGIVDAFDRIFTPLVDILDVLGEAIGVLLEPLFTLLADILEPIGNIILEILNCLRPLIDIISMLLNIFVQLCPIGRILTTILNILKPVLNLIAKAFEAIFKVIASFWNAIVSFFSVLKIPYGFSISWSGIRVKWKSLADILGMSKVSTSLSSGGSSDNATSEAGAASGGNSASYSAAKDVYVNIYYNNSYVNGDAQAIAINLAREIRRAESKNLI